MVALPPPSRLVIFRQIVVAQCNGSGIRSRRAAMTKATHGIAALPQAKAVITRLAAGRLRTAGADLRHVLKEVGITERDLDDPEQKIGSDRQIAFLAAAAEALDDDLLGFRLAQNIDCRELGLLY